MIPFENTEAAFRYKTNSGLKHAYLLFLMLSNPIVVWIVKRLTLFALKIHLPINWAIKPTLYKHFVGGENIEECESTIKILSKFNVKTILDYSVEGGKDAGTMERTLVETLRTIKNASQNPYVPFAVFKPTAFASQDVLTQAASNPTISPEAQEGIRRFRSSVEKLCKTAWELNTPIMIDAEDSWYQSTIDEIITAMMEKFNREKAIVFNTLQMYRTDRLTFLNESITKARDGNYFLGIKFVRGAYMEKERRRAAVMGYPSPIHTDKASTDNAYDEALRIAVKNIDCLALFNGSHNENSNRLLTELMNDRNLSRNDQRIWFSQLYGMSDHISFNLANEGYNVAKYVPYGPVLNILPYLLRRAEENTSIAGQSSRELPLIRMEMKRRNNK